MLSLLSIIALIPLAASAARIPHQVLDLDATLVSDTSSALGLGIAPRAPNPVPGPFDVIDNIPIVKDVVHTVTALLPDINAGVSFCITLAADANIAADGDSVFLAAGTCLCVDAAAGVGSGITVQASTGQTFTGNLAVKLRNSVSHPLTPLYLITG